MRKESLSKGLSLIGGYSAYKFLKTCFDTVGTSNPITKFGFTLVEVAYGVVSGFIVGRVTEDIIGYAESAIEAIKDTHNGSKTDVVHFADEGKSQKETESIYDDPEYKKAGCISPADFYDPAFNSWPNYVIYYYPGDKVALTVDGSRASFNDSPDVEKFVFEILPTLLKKGESCYKMAYYRDWLNRQQVIIICFPFNHKMPEEKETQNV